MVGSNSINERVLVCGTGSIGRRHIANLLSLGANVSVWRSQTHLLDEISEEFSVDVYDNLDDAIHNAGSVIVATATDKHIPIAIKALQAGKGLFLEKPISHSWHGIDELRRLAEGKTVEIGCQFRTHQNLIRLSDILKRIGHDKIITYRLAMGHRLDAWRTGRDYRETYSSDAGRGGGALFDLIHQIDLALWLFGPVAEVNAVLSNRSGLEISGDDVSNLLLTHESGVTGHIQLDMASPVYRCEAEVMARDSVFKWTYEKGILYEQNPMGQIIIDRLPEDFERNHLFLAHMGHFLERLKNNKLPAFCSIEDGIAALKIAISAREANLYEKKVNL
jgi:predicted dehydrogenase